MNYAGSATETLELVLEEVVAADDEELDTDAIPLIVLDLLKVGRGDLAIPFVRLWAERTEALLESAHKYRSMSEAERDD